MSDMVYHVRNLDVANYLGRYCYPKFLGSAGTTRWKRKIHAYRVRYYFNGAGIPEVLVWQTLGYAWVACHDIEFIWDYVEAS